MMLSKTAQQIKDAIVSRQIVSVETLLSFPGYTEEAYDEVCDNFAGFAINDNDEIVLTANESQSNALVFSVHWVQDGNNCLELFQEYDDAVKFKMHIYKIYDIVPLILETPVRTAEYTKGM